MSKTTTTDDPETTDVLAPLDEQQEAAVQLDKIREYTVRPGLLRLPVGTLNTTTDSDRNVLYLDHPHAPDGDFEFHIPKPDIWDPEAYFWVRLLDWYGYTPASQYHLQTDHVYVKRVPHAAGTRLGDDDNPRVSANGGWKLVAPPSDRRRDWWRWQDAAGNALPGRLASAGRLATTPIRRARRAPPADRAGVVWTVAFLAFTVTATIALTSWSALGIGTVSSAFIVALAGGALGLALAAIAVLPPGGAQ